MVLGNLNIHLDGPSTVIISHFLDFLSSSDLVFKHPAWTTSIFFSGFLPPVPWLQQPFDRTWTCSPSILLPFHYLLSAPFSVPSSILTILIPRLVTVMTSLHLSSTSLPILSFLKKLIYFIDLFLAVLGLCCCARTFSSCSEWRLLSVEVRGLLIAVASLVAEHGL